MNEIFTKGKRMGAKFLSIILISIICLASFSAIDVIGGEQPPDVKISYPIEQYPFFKVTGKITIKGTAHDPDGDDDIYELTIRITPGAVPDFTPVEGVSNWSFEWDTTKVPDSDYWIYLQVKDKNQNVGHACANVTVNNKPGSVNQIPTVRIFELDDKVSGITTIEGKAYDDDGEIEKVEIRIDDGPWEMATDDTSIWSYDLISTEYTDGIHEFSVRAFDGTSYSFVETIKIIIENDPSDNLPLFEWGGSFESVDILRNKPIIADIDGDGDYDMMTASSGGSQFYENIGNKKEPLWAVSKMAFPYRYSLSITSLVDLDDDNDLDAVGVERDNIYYFENEGTSITPDWYELNLRFIPHRYGHVIIDEEGSGAPLIPGITPRDRSHIEFGDLDNDGDLDLIFSDYNTYLSCFYNIGTKTEPIWNQSNSITSHIEVLPGYSRPTLADIDGDNDLDLIIAEKEFKETATLKFYKNVAETTDPNWQFDSNWTDLMKNENVSGVAFVDIDDDGDLDIFASSGFNMLIHYENVGDAGNPNWSKMIRPLDDIELTPIGTPLVFDYDRDGDLDIFTFDISKFDDGKPSYYENVGSTTKPNYRINHSVIDNLPDVDEIQNMAFSDLDNDGRYEMTIIPHENNLWEVGTISPIYYINKGTMQDPIWTLQEFFYPSSVRIHNSRPYFIDTDKDGDLDLFYQYFSEIKYLINDGNKKSPKWDLTVITLDQEFNSKRNMVFIDIDQDGIIEVISSGDEFECYQIIDLDPYFAITIDDFFKDFAFGDRAQVDVGDMDGDGDYDLIVSNYYFKLRVIENLGTSFAGQTLNDKHLLTEVGWDIRFNASLYSTQENSSYKWFFGDDVSTNWDNDPVSYHSYKSIGTYSPILLIKDNQSSTTIIDSFKIKVIKQNLLPRIIIEWEEFRKCYEERPVDFDASNSYDPDGDLVEFKWDFGNGETSTGSTYRTSYSEPGIYNISLVITDSNGSSRSVTFSFEVFEMQKPINGHRGYYGLLFYFILFMIPFVIIIGFIIAIIVIRKPKKRKRSRKKIKKRKKRRARSKRT